MPARFAAVGDRHAAIDDRPCSLEALLELSGAHEREGLGDAPWPPHYRKQAGEPPRVAPSRARKPRSKRPRREAPERRRSRPARTAACRCSRSAARATKDDALAGLERWKARHPDAAAHLEPADVLVDAMRGRFQTWTRIRVNLQHVPEALRPAQEPLDPDEDPLSEDWEKAIGCPAPKTFASSYGVVTSSWS